MKIKAFLLTMVVILSVFVTTSCKENVKDREYDEAEVVTAAKDLIEKSVILNEIYYGYGIQYDSGDLNNANGNYFPADFLSLEKFNVQTLEDIKKLTRECFTVGLSNNMINTVLSSVKDDDGNIINFARYYQEYDSLDLSKEKCIMVNSKANILFEDKVDYYYDTLRVSDVEGEKIFVTLKVKVTNADDGASQEKEITVELLEEDSGFRIDSYTFVNYSDKKH